MLYAKDEKQTDTGGQPILVPLFLHAPYLLELLEVKSTFVQSVPGIFNLSIFLSFYLSMSLFISVYLSILFISVYLSIHRSIDPSIYIFSFYFSFFASETLFNLLPSSLSEFSHLFIVRSLSHLFIVRSLSHLFIVRSLLVFHYINVLHLQFCYFHRLHIPRYSSFAFPRRNVCIRIP